MEKLESYIRRKEKNIKRNRYKGVDNMEFILGIIVGIIITLVIIGLYSCCRLSGMIDDDNE